MINKIKDNILLQQIIKFGFVGGLAFVIDYLVLIICKELFGISILISTAVAFTISVIFNYIASVKWVFEVDSTNSAKKNFILFTVLSIIGLIITEIIMHIGTHELKISYLIVKIFATAVVMVFNFITRKIFLENKGTDTIKKYLSTKIAIIIYATISYVSLCLFNSINAYDIFSLIMFIFITVTFLKYFKINEKDHKGITILSAIFSILTVFGDLVMQYMKQSNINICIELIKPRSLFCLLGFYLLYKTILNIIIPKLAQQNILKKDYSLSKRKMFIIAFIIIIICYLPYFLTMFPGTLSSDSAGELYRVITGPINSNHHPVCHVLLIKLAYTIGNGIFHNITAVVAIYSVIQMVIMAAIFAYSVTFLYEKKVNTKILIAMTLFYAITPIFGIVL